MSTKIFGHNVFGKHYSPGALGADIITGGMYSQAKAVADNPAIAAGVGQVAAGIGMDQPELITSGAKTVATDQKNKRDDQNAKSATRHDDAMANSAYKRAMQDMRDSGLNPILAHSQGGAGYSPAHVPEYQSPIAAGVDQHETTRHKRAETEKVKKEVEHISQSIKSLAAASDLTDKQIELLSFELLTKFTDHSIKLEDLSLVSDKALISRIETAFLNDNKFLVEAEASGISPAKIGAVVAGLVQIYGGVGLLRMLGLKIAKAKAKGAAKPKSESAAKPKGSGTPRRKSSTTPWWHSQYESENRHKLYRKEGFKYND